MTGYLEEERKKPRLEGMASELVNPPKDFAAIKAAEAEYKKRCLEASGKLPKSNLSRGQQAAMKRIQLILVERKKRALETAEPLKVKLFKYLDEIVKCKESKKNGIDVKMANVKAKGKQLFTYVYGEIMKFSTKDPREPNNKCKKASFATFMDKIFALEK